jgi:GNAT superfamily N-acetyltransferase
VSSSAEGHGAGRALVEAAEEWARFEGLELITLNVFANNQRARSVYERLGYAPETLHYVKPLT